MVDGLFEDAWDALDATDRSLLLEERDTLTVPPEVAEILVRAGLVAFGHGSGDPRLPVHWPPGLRDFLGAKAALWGDDPDCE